MNINDWPAAKRALSIDILRGFALVGMVLVHFMIYFGNPAAMNTWLYFSLNHIMGDLGASGFLLIMGISQVLSGRKHADLEHRLIFKQTLIRGGFIFTIGLLMLAMAWGPEKIWQWDILTLMGFATVLLFFCRFLPSWIILFAAFCIAFCTPFLRGQLAVASIWNNNFMPVPVISSYFPGILFDPAVLLKTGWSIKDIIQGFLFTGDFPVFPWIFFPLIGVVLGRRITEQKMQGDLPLLLFISIIFVFLGLGLGYAGSLRPGASVISGYITPLCFYPDSFSMIFLQLGMSSAIIFICYYLYDIRGTNRPEIGFFAGIFTSISHSSLTFYFLHGLLIGWPLALIYVFSSKYYLYNLMEAIPAFACGLTAVVLLALGLGKWDKMGGKYKLEWFLAALIRRWT